MATETETRTGACPTHGTVAASREMPRLGFPFLYFGVRRFLARRRPFRCPTCGQPVST
jgi:hypothetical protein